MSELADTVKHTVCRGCSKRRICFKPALLCTTCIRKVEMAMVMQRAQMLAELRRLDEAEHEAGTAEEMEAFDG